MRVSTIHLARRYPATQALKHTVDLSQCSTLKECLDRTFQTNQPFHQTQQTIGLPLYCTGEFGGYENAVPDKPVKIKFCAILQLFSVNVTK